MKQILPFLLSVLWIASAQTPPKAEKPPVPPAAASTPANWTYSLPEGLVLFLPVPNQPDVYTPVVQLKDTYNAEWIVITAFYHQSAEVGGQKLNLLRSAASMAPYAGPEAGGGGDNVALPAKPEYVQLRLLKVVKEIEFGKKPK